MNTTDTTPADHAAGSEPYPCPFCGRMAKTSVASALWSAGCPSCGIETMGLLSRDEAVEAWNQRSGWDHKAVGASMREERTRRGLSIRAMAKCMGCSAPYVSDLEKGRRAWTPNALDWYRSSLPPNTKASDATISP